MCTIFVYCDSNTELLGKWFKIKSIDEFLNKLAELLGKWFKILISVISSSSLSELLGKWFKIDRLSSL